MAMLDALLADPVAIAVLGGMPVLVILAIVAIPLLGEQQARARRFDMYLRTKKTKDKEARADRSEAKKKQIQNRVKALAENKKGGKSRYGAIRGLMVQAGIDIPVSQFWLMSFGVGVLLTAVAFFGNFELYMVPLAFLLGTFGVPRFVLKKIAARRQKEFTKHFANAVDVLVRGIKSGLPVGECFRIIARESPAPVGPEFSIVLDEVNAGLTMEEALARAYERMPTQELKFFATVISVQSQTGGNLAEILGSISSVLRGRAQLKEKIKALAGEATASSMIIGALPFVVGTILTIVNYNYISILWTTRSGKMLLGFALCMLSFGVWVMQRMGKIDA